MRPLPFFLTMEGCPRRCVYCHQGEITGISRAPSPAEVKQAAAEQKEPCEVCFFGGSFTCLPSVLQREYLDAALAAPVGSIIRFSTHPECITEDTLGILASYPVRMIELGISSLDDGVLARCRRGYSSRSALEAMKRVLDSGFLLGAQMMIGLPEQTEESSLTDLDLIAGLKASFPPPSGSTLASFLKERPSHDPGGKENILPSRSNMPPAGQAASFCGQKPWGSPFSASDFRRRKACQNQCLQAPITRPSVNWPVRRLCPCG